MFSHKIAINLFYNQWTYSFLGSYLFEQIK